MFTATINGRRIRAEFLAEDLPGLFGRRIEVAVRISVGRHKPIDAVYACSPGKPVERFPNPDGTDALAEALRVPPHQVDEALAPIQAQAQRLHDAAARRLEPERIE